LRDEFHEVLRRGAAWLDDYALFMAVKDTPSGSAVAGMARSSATFGSRRSSRRLAPIWPTRWTSQRFPSIPVLPPVAATQDLRNEHGIRIIGDIPIFVSPIRRRVGRTRSSSRSTRSAVPSSSPGVPPDYFSETGQLWAIRTTTGRDGEVGVCLVDRALSRPFSKPWMSFASITFGLLRGDWEVRPEVRTAIKGRWVKGRASVAQTMQESFRRPADHRRGPGCDHAEVDSLRRAFELPGMRILQFASARRRRIDFLRTT